MNRRSFIGNLAGALAGFAVLPPATTYGRVWRATRPAHVTHYANLGVWRLLQECGRSAWVQVQPIDMDAMAAIMEDLRKIRPRSGRVEILASKQTVQDWFWGRAI